ncbi:Hypothetical predicted protein [Mytilus galloprovincialis]|uniref:P2X purinoreceptor 7 intracellular domain-containing protein n=1 Tax=Mytilus galloprovincialis TaxID=29158 RepID=A0A8B6DUE8_MYTGA|nr:Hypothetical predicted protein [Mytilus galloprovincialis]
MDREDKMGLVPYNFEPEYSVQEMNTNSVAEPTSQQAFPTLEEWCDCGNCQQMPSPEECVCCRHAEFVYPNLEDHQCITQIESFDKLILNPDVLALSFIQMMMFKRQRVRAPDQLNSRQSRLVAYRQFVCLMLKGERLGKGNRVVIPSCVVRKIRDAFLDDDGDYTGFKLAIDDVLD